MNKKGILKSSLEFDAIYGKRIYCYIHNDNKIVRYAKTRLRRRLRREGKEYIRRRLWEE